MTDFAPESNEYVFPDFDTMTPAEFENHLPDFFAASSNGKVSSNPQLQKFLSENPDCAALVHDLEEIAEAVRKNFLTPEDADSEDPSDQVWKNIANKMSVDPGLIEPEAESLK